MSSNEINDHTRFMLCIQCYDSAWELGDCAQFLENALNAIKQNKKSLESIEDFETFLKETMLLLNRVEEMLAKNMSTPDDEFTSEMIMEMTKLEVLNRNIRTVRHVLHSGHIFSTT